MSMTTAPQSHQTAAADLQAAASAAFRVPPPVNEPVLPYRPGDPERKALKDELARMSGETPEIRLPVGSTGKFGENHAPHRSALVTCRYEMADREAVGKAIDRALEARKTWSVMPWQERAAVFLKAAELIAGPMRSTINAAAMLGQSKTAFQAEIDAACESIDFLRFNVHFMQQIYEMQPLSSGGVWNRMEYRPLEGFVLAVTPFNFLSIGLNLPMAAALMGNVVIWKPASSTVLGAHHVMKLWEKAGLPEGVITLLPGSGSAVGDPVLDHPDLAGVHFTGSTSVFQGMWKRVGENIARYKTYPRIVGETGGKDFVVAHRSADPAALATALVRGAYEFQGQKCSAASRAYVPDNLWPEVKDRMLAQIADIKVGDVADFRNFMGAVIDRDAYTRIKSYVEHAKTSKDVEVVHSGIVDDSEGWFVGPQLIRTDDPAQRLMCEEIFGPVMTVYVYPEQRYEETLRLCDSTSPYGLTGAIFATERGAIAQATSVLLHAAGNFYVNDKPTGAVVGQQPFGGSRASGTNDKAGSVLNLLRWVSPRTIKETFAPPTDFRYPFMEAE